MKIGILGTGDVGKAIGKGFAALGHEVMLAGREGNNPKAHEWAQATQAAGHKGSAGSFADAAAFGEIIVIATLGQAAEAAISMAGADHFRGKLVWDTTNPLDFSAGFPPKLVGGLGTSLGEKIQAAVPHAHVVKVFNTVGNALFFRPQLQGGIRPDMFICGDNADAKARTQALVADFGWDTVDIGGIATAHYLEAMCLVWVLSAAPRNRWMQAFKLLTP